MCRWNTDTTPGKWKSETSLFFAFSKNYSLIHSFILFFANEFWNVTRLGEWGDHLTLQAAADRVSFLKMKYHVLSLLQTRSLLWYLPHTLFLLLSNRIFCKFHTFYLNDWLTHHYCSSKPRSAYSHHFGNNPTSRYFLITRTLFEVQTLSLSALKPS